MKKGSGNLDFGQADDATESDPDSGSGSEADSTQNPNEGSTTVEESQPSPSKPIDEEATDSSVPANDSAASEQNFPYFVRRSNVGDERDTRLEIHARPEVVKKESTFRNALADALETDEVAKTDGREFALKFAFENPDAVAELMREEGYGLTD